MRVGLDARFLSDAFPGIGRHVHGLLLALASAREACEVVAWVNPDEPQSRFPLEPLARAGIRFEEVRVPVRSLAEQVVLPRLARARRLDLVHSPYPFTALAWPCPWVVTVHDLIPLEVRGSLPGLHRRAAFGLALRAALLRADAVLVPSLATARSLRGFAPGCRPLLVPPALDPRYLAAGPRRESGDANRSLPRSVLCVGSNRPHKNVSRLLEAWRLLEDRGRTEELLLVGEDEARFPSVVARARELGTRSVRFLGRVAEDTLPELYRRADVVVVPSVSEGFCLPLLEALASGTAVACSRVPALLELGGDAVTSFDPEDPGSMAAALGALLDDPGRRAEQARLGDARARSFTAGACAAALLAAYREAAGGTCSGREG